MFSRRDSRGRQVMTRNERADCRYSGSLAEYVTFCPSPPKEHQGGEPLSWTALRLLPPPELQKEITEKAKFVAKVNFDTDAQWGYPRNWKMARP